MSSPIVPRGAVSDPVNQAASTGGRPFKSTPNNANIRKRPAAYEIPMIARHWRGWTKAQNADAYETLLKTRVLPDLSKIA
jgi:hypothetical protein